MCTLSECKRCVSNDRPLLSVRELDGAVKSTFTIHNNHLGCSDSVMAFCYRTWPRRTVQQPCRHQIMLCTVFRGPCYMYYTRDIARNDDVLQTAAY